MQMLILKLLSDLVCGGLNALGGWRILWMRRYLMPVVIAVTLSIVSHTWWLGLTILPVMGTLCLGYFGSGFFGRGLWLLLQASVIGIGATLSAHLPVFYYFLYILGAGILGGTLYNLEQFIADFIFGCWLGTVVFLVH